MGPKTATTRVRTPYQAIALFWFNLCLCLLAINGIAAIVMSVWSSQGDLEEPAHVNEALARVYPHLTDEDRKTLREENRRGFEAEVVGQFREKRATGRFTNLDEHGFRRSREQGPWPPEERFYNIFILGGSTAFGYGVPDDDTIASHLQELLAQIGLRRPPRVYNFARGSFYSSMERVLFDKLVTLGPKPDLAIFLDGLNEFYWQSDPPRLTKIWTERAQKALDQPMLAVFEDLAIVRLIKTWRSQDLIAAIAKEPPVVYEPEVAEQKSDQVIERYLANKSIIEAIAASAGIPVMLVWQPVPTYGYDLRHHVFDGNFGRHELTRTGYPRMKRRLREQPPGEHFIWCAEIQRGVERLLYVDKVHYSPEMSRRVARCIVDAIARRRLLPVS